MIAKRLMGHLPVNIAQAVAGFGAVAAYTRLLDPEDYGRYALILVASQLIHTLTFTWAEAAAFRFHASAKAQGTLPDHFATLLSIMLASTVLCVVIIAGLCFALSKDRVLATAAALAVAASLFRFITRIARETDRADLNVTRYSVGEMVFSLVGLGLGITCALTTNFGPGAPFLGLMAASLIMTFPDLRRLIADAKGGKPAMAQTLAFAGYGMPLALALSLELAVQAGARFTIAGQLGEASVGAYAAAFGLARTIDLLFVWGAMAAAPLALTAFETENRTAMLAVARDMARTLYALTVPAMVGLILVAQPLAQTMVGKALAGPTAEIIPLLAISGFFAGFSTYYFSEAYQLTRRTGLRAAVMLVPAVLTVVFVGVGAGAYGLMGAAAATALATALGTGLLALIGRSILPLPLALPDLGLTLIAALCMVPVVWAIPALGGWAELLAKATAGALTYGLAAMAFNIAGSRSVVAGVWQQVSDKVRARLG